MKIFKSMALLLCISLTCSAQNNTLKTKQVKQLLADASTAFQQKDWEAARTNMSKASSYHLMQDSVKIYGRTITHYQIIDSIITLMQRKEIGAATIIYNRHAESLNNQAEVAHCWLKNTDWAEYYNCIPFVMQNKLYITQVFADSINSIINKKIFFTTNATMNNKKIPVEVEGIIQDFLPIKNGIGGIYFTIKVKNLNSLNSQPSTVRSVFTALEKSLSGKRYLYINGQELKPEQAEPIREATANSIMLSKIDNLLLPKEKGGEWLYVDSSGKEYFAKSYNMATNYSHGFAVVRAPGLAYIDIFGNTTNSWNKKKEH